MGFESREVRTKPLNEVHQSLGGQGLIRRFFVTQRHLAGLLFGGLIAGVRERREAGKGGLVQRFQRVVASIARPFIDRQLVDEPFPVQFRRRLEILGPTYIKLGQILSLREDLLPTAVTEELKNLLDQLPQVPYDTFVKQIEEDLGRPLPALFESVEKEPIGSASIAQTHRAVTVEGDPVILKVVKPGIPQTLKRDARLLKMLGWTLHLVWAHYQPKRVIAEFVNYTLREVDLRREADNAETFSANFKDMPDVAFPKIYRDYSGRRVLCMEFFDGIKPSDPQARELPDADKDRLIDLGAGSIIRMLYKDGFFHADLHPGNLMILPGPRCGFIDLGMVGRFDDDLRRVMLYYYYCLVIGDAENAARYLTDVADPGPGANPTGFRRDVEEISRRWARASTFKDFSLAQLILESVRRAGQYRMYFPVEMILMVKALVTFEGVGQLLKPGFDVASISKAHTQRIFIAQFSPLRLAKEGLRGAPEVVDALVKAPLLVTEGLRFLEKTTRAPASNPLLELRNPLIAGFCIVAGALLLATKGPWPAWALLFLVALIMLLRRS